MDTGVQGVGLAGAGGAGDEDQALRLCQGAAERLQLVGLEAEHLQRRHVVALGEDPDDGLLAVQARQGGHAGVDARPADADLGPAVLRHATLGDVEPRDDLDAAEHGSRSLARRRHDVAQDPVHAEADAEAVALGLDVDVAGVNLHGLGEDLVDQLHGGGVVDRGALVVVDGQLLADVLHHGREAVTAGRESPGAPELVPDLRLDRDDRQQLAAQVHPGLVQRHDVGRVRHRDDESLVGQRLERDDAAALARLLRDQADHLDVQHQRRQVEGVHAQLVGEGDGDVALVDQAELHEHLTEPPPGAGPPLLGQRLLQLLRGDDCGVHEQVAEAASLVAEKGEPRVRQGSAVGLEDAHPLVFGTSPIRL